MASGHLTKKGETVGLVDKNNQEQEVRAQVAVNMTHEMTHMLTPHVNVFFHLGSDLYEFTTSLKEALQANIDDPLLHLVVIDMGNHREKPWHNDMQHASDMMELGRSQQHAGNSMQQANAMVLNN